MTDDHLAVVSDTARATVLLVVAGNDDSGKGTVWVSSDLTKSPVVIKIAEMPVSLSVNTLCGMYPSAQCRNLTVNSIQFDDVSNHTVFVPLQNGIFILEFAIFNGYTQPLVLNETLLVRQKVLLDYGVNDECPSNCESLGVYEAGLDLYSLCSMFPDTLCTCKLSKNYIGYSLQNCHVLAINNGSAGSSQVFNLVFSSHHALIWFTVGQKLFQLNPEAGVLHELNSFPDCIPIYQLNFDDVHNKLYIYCGNNASIIYNLDEAWIIMLFVEKVFPCPDNASVTIGLPSDQGMVDIFYTNRGVRTSNFLPQSSDFIFGVCFSFRGNHIFLYTDEGFGIYLYNTTEDKFFKLWSNVNAQICVQNQCKQPLIFNDMYFITLDPNQEVVDVFDLDNFSTPIITVCQGSFELISIIGINDAPVLAIEGTMS